MMFESRYPFTQTLNDALPVLSEVELNAKLLLTAQAKSAWKNRSLKERNINAKNFATIIRIKKDTLARLITLEMGKSSREANAEIEKCAATCEYYAAQADVFLQSECIPTEARDSRVYLEPLGCILGIMPWNFPFWQVVRFALPVLTVGNVVLLKHAPNVPLCSRALEEIFLEAGYPPGVFQSLLIDVPAVNKLLSMPLIQGVSLTGSEKAGSAVGSLAGKYIKKAVMELGGSDPCIVFDDADIEQAAKIAVASRLQNAGQSCIAAKRFIVLDSVKDAFTEKVRDEIRGYRQGDPMLPETHIGPMARLDLVQNLKRQWDTSVKMGARIRIPMEIEGCNVSPGLLDRVSLDMPVCTEETFGPLCVIMHATGEAQAVELANQTPYGLGASIWTQDLDKARIIASQIEAGSVFVNSQVRSDPRLPFGGVKNSGYGRELSYLGLREFANVKTVYLHG